MLYPELDPGTEKENISRKIGEIWIMSVYLIVSYQCSCLGFDKYTMVK